MIERTGQIKIYASKCMRIFLNERGWKIFISSAIITLIISLVTSEEMFAQYSDTRNGSFALVCACIWIGIFNSIQSVCKERDILKREHRSGLHMSSYIIAHMIFELAVCLVESVIVTAIISLTYISKIPAKGVMMIAAAELCVTFFLTIYSSDVLGLMISSVVKTPTTAMTVMPFVLIIQLVMSGMIFELKGVTEFIAKLTISKWSMNAICITANVNAMEKYIPQFYNDYEFSIAHISQMWLILLIFAFIYGILAIVSLEFIDRDKR